MGSEFNKEYFHKICEKLENDRFEGLQVFPPRDKIFAAFNHSTWDNLKVVIIGQDPYHKQGQAHGLSFSVNFGIAVPPSLRNIYTELENDVQGFRRPSHGNLEAWASQGVLLLNASLTVIEGKPNSHQDIGWKLFTDSVIRVINKEHDGVVFLLWGAFAKKKGQLVDRTKHRVFEAAHPSPMAANRGGWFGCQAFSKCNTALMELGKLPVNWQN